MLKTLCLCAVLMSLPGFANADFDRLLCPDQFAFTNTVSGSEINPYAVDGKLEIHAVRTFKYEYETRLPGICAYEGKDSKGRIYEVSMSTINKTNLTAPFQMMLSVQTFITEYYKFYFDSPSFQLVQLGAGQKYKIQQDLGFSVEPKFWDATPIPSSRYCYQGNPDPHCIPIPAW